MRRAFTLLEMMIVVALIATMMTIVLRLSSVNQENTKRNTTILRLQRLENCLSGYYAAYGNYPPVRLHNTRDINQGADGHGVQSEDASPVELWGWSEVGDDAEVKAWAQVEAACRAQPIGAEFPLPDSDDTREDVRDFMTQLKKNLSSGQFANYPKSGTREYESLSAGFDGLQSNLGRFQNKGTAYSWRDIQVFKFGLMSFLLPRYQIMMLGNKEIYTTFAQWSKNNGTVSNPMTGQQYTWSELSQLSHDIDRSTSTETRSQKQAQLENIPADAVCARWLPNLEEICAGMRPGHVYFGVNILKDSESTLSVSDDPDSEFPTIHVYSPTPNSTRDQYMLDSITVLDGWKEEFYYYSPSPHQSYQLWSSGANMRTFPPWIPRSELTSKANECVLKWTSDDIGGMRN